MTCHGSLTVCMLVKFETSLKVRYFYFYNVIRLHVFLTGDTAQTVMKDVSFRFKDLKFRMEEILMTNHTK